MKDPELVNNYFILEGVCPVLETPFKADEGVDLPSFEGLIHHLYRSGVRSVMFPGFASEFFKLGEDEKRELLDLLMSARSELAGLSVIASVAHPSTHRVLSEIEYLQGAGVDAINVLPSFLSDPPKTSRRRHLEEIMRAAGETAVILQYAPNQTSAAMSGDDLTGLAREFPNFRQVKVEATPAGAFMTQLAQGEPTLGSIVGYAGVQLIDGLRRGAQAVQPGCSFVEIYLSIWECWHTGDKQSARLLHQKLLPYISYWMQSIELIIQAEKSISHRRGLIATSVCRRPHRPLDHEEDAMVTRFLREFEGLL